MPQVLPHPTEDSTPVVSRELVTSMVPEDILHSDEVVLILKKPSLWFIPLTSARFLVATFLLAYLAVRIETVTNSISPQNIALIASIMMVGRLFWALLVWTGHIYMLTNQRIVTIKGVANVTMWQANLRKVQRTVLYKPVIDRIFGIATIGFSTAAAGGSSDWESTWVMISRPLKTHEQIVAAINQAQR